MNRTFPLMSRGLLGLALAWSASAFAQGTQPAEGAEAGAAESRWPLQVEQGDDEITIYQPQLESFKGDKLAARAAVSIQKRGQAESVFGAMWIESRVATDRVARTVEILEVNVTQARFPDAEEASVPTLTDALRKGLAGHSMTLSLDQLLEMLAVVEKEKQTSANLRTDPPKIEFRTHPAVLVEYDGAPRVSQVTNSTLMRAVNTPFLVALDPATKTYYLKGPGQWFSAPDALGPFQDAGDVPAAVTALAQEGGYEDPNEPATDANAEAVEIVTATEPTELIWTDGPAEMGAIAGTDLLYVTNTDADVFLDIATQDVYVLLSGRWYTAKSRQGPWSYVPADKLPADFKRIPPGSDKGDVLAGVPGTEAAQDAVLDADVPQTAAVNRKTADKPQVTFDGDPQFEPVEGTEITYAVNTGSSVLKVSDRYYCCDNAVWYVGPAATGPWEVCAEVPPVVYTIPPSCPLYPVRYVHVYGATPDVVYCGYTPGYVGCYAYGGAVVYGTGYYYHGWYGRYYIPRPHTFGFSAHYNAYTGNWGFTVGASGPNGWFGFHAGSRGWVAAGGNWHGGGWWGSGGYRPVGFDRNVAFRGNEVNINRNNVNINRNQTFQANNNIYNRRNDVQRELPRQPVAARRGAMSGAGAAGAGRAGRAEVSRPTNNVFAGPDGNVYRKTLDGWETRDKGQWKPPSGTAPQRAGGAAEAPKPARPGAAERPGQPPRAGEGPKPAERPAARPANPNFDQQRQNLERENRARAAGQQRPQSYQRPAPAAAPRGGGGGRGGGRR